MAAVGAAEANIKAFIRATKSDLDHGKWSVGRVARAAFPMSRLREKYYRFGPDWNWRVVKFSALGFKCRVLILYNPSKVILRARFGVDINGDMVVLCDHEFHASEPGWHCHVTFDDVQSVAPGAARHDKRKWPQTVSPRQAFVANQADALAVVATRYGFVEQGALGI